MNWEALAASCTAATVICSLAGYIFRLAVREEIRRQFDTFGTRFSSYITNKEFDDYKENMREKVNSLQKQIETAENYAHSSVHEIRNRAFDIFEGKVKER